MLPALMYLQRWGRKQWQPARVQRVHDECLHQMPAIQLEPRSVVDPSPMRGGLAEIRNRLTLRAAVGDFMAVETQSDETPFWLVQVSAAAQDAPPDYRNGKVKEAVFEFKRNSKAVKVLQPPRGGATKKKADFTTQHNTP